MNNAQNKVPSSGLSGITTTWVFGVVMEIEFYYLWNVSLAIQCVPLTKHLCNVKAGVPSNVFSQNSFVSLTNSCSIVTRPLFIPPVHTVGYVIAFSSHSSVGCRTTAVYNVAQTSPGLKGLKSRHNLAQRLPNTFLVNYVCNSIQ